MSITRELAHEFKDSPAIVCCRTTKGTVISPGDLEDPSIFKDMEESGLISITEDTLTIGEVLGAKLVKDIDGLTSLTADLLEGTLKKTKDIKKNHDGGNKVNKEVYVNDGVLHIEVE